MSVYDLENPLFHRCVNKDNEPRDTVEVYESPLPTLLYDKDTPENPLQGMNIPRIKGFIYFGTFNGEPIKWRILGESPDKRGFVLISNVILFMKEFDPSTNVWKNSSLRTYLNSDFYNNSFSEEEKESIISAVTDYNLTDKVFLLSAVSTDTYSISNYSYLSSNYNRIATYNNTNTPWWLRSQGLTSGYTAGVAYDGTINTYGADPEMVVGVRPVIVIKNKKYTTVNLGNYNNQPIEWRVLDYDVKNQGVVLLSEYALFEDVFDTQENGDWRTSSLRTYLNEDFFNFSFSSSEKRYIKRIDVASNISDKVFLLSGKSSEKYSVQQYFGLNSNDKRIAVDSDGNIQKWWLRSVGSIVEAAEIVFINGAIDEEISNFSGYYVRPVIVVDINALGQKNGIINPIYGSSIWGRMTFPYSKDKDNYYLTVSDPFSVHNQKYQNHNREIYDKVKKDFAVFSMTKNNSIINVEYNYIFRNETIVDSLSITSMGNLRDGIYITQRCVFIKEGNKVYQSGFTSTLDTFEEIFLSKFEEKNLNSLSDTFPEYAIYASCWADLDPRLELYLPVSNFTGTSHSLKYYWLGETFCRNTYSITPNSYTLDSELETIFKAICAKYERGYI